MASSRLGPVVTSGLAVAFGAAAFALGGWALTHLSPDCSALPVEECLTRAAAQQQLTAGALGAAALLLLVAGLAMLSARDGWRRARGGS